MDIMNDFNDIYEDLDDYDGLTDKDKAEITAEILKAEALNNIASKLYLIGQGITYTADSQCPSISETLIEMKDNSKDLVMAIGSIAEAIEEVSRKGK